MIYGLGLICACLVAVVFATYIIGGYRKERDMVRDYVDTAEKTMAEATRAKSDPVKLARVREKYTRK